MRRLRYTWVVLLLFFVPFGDVVGLQTSHIPTFDGTNAMMHLIQQCDFGPRPPGSHNLTLSRLYIISVLESFGWQVTLQNFTYLGVECTNIIGRWGHVNNASVILGAHYDTRPHADEDPDPANWTLPVLGANDGASGTAVLLELSRVLPESVRSSVEIVFFDAEDSGGLSGWDWILGSTHYVQQLSSSRKEEVYAMILLDMVGDENLRLLRETSSTRSLQDTVWSLAANMGHDEIFIDTLGGGVFDDHWPFLDAGIPALNIVHHNPFPAYWHTLEDTPDKCNATSLQVVGQVVETFIVDELDVDTTFSPNPPDYISIALLVVPPIVLIGAIMASRRR
ncbi:MAG: M28 family peptidase [Candidatus Thorarchaeota archaeon]